jgi:putative copper export protein
VVLAVAVLPRVLREQNLSELLRFESAYEKIGMPALIIQVMTGLWLAYAMLPDVRLWFIADNSVSRSILLKLVLLLATVLLAADARLRIIPRLSVENLQALAYHIIPVTIISVLFVVVGVSFRTGGFL